MKKNNYRRDQHIEQSQQSTSLQRNFKFWQIDEMFNNLNLFRIPATLVSYMTWSSSKAIVLCDVSRNRRTIWIVHENQISKHSTDKAPSRWWRAWIWLVIQPVFRNIVHVYILDLSRFAAKFLCVTLMSTGHNNASWTHNWGRNTTIVGTN